MSSDNSSNDLSKLSAGLLEGEYHTTAYNWLFENWSNLEGSDQHSTTADKLYRAEDLAWQPPLLTFLLERHGGTVNGSSRADLHHWEIDTEKKTARIAHQTRRQLTPTSPRLNTKELARQMTEQVLNQADHPTLDWIDEDTFRINISELIPESNAQTTAQRRKRFYRDFVPMIEQHGWISEGEGRWRKFIRRHA